MTVRIYPFLLSVSLLLVLNACTTTSPAPVSDSSVEYDRSSDTESDAQFQQATIKRDQSELSLAEVDALSKSMTGYQPDLTLEILRSLESASSGQLTTLIDSQQYDPEFTEWLELSLQLRTVLINGSPVTAAAQQWANYHFGHAVGRSEFIELVSRYGALFPIPSQVAIM